MKNNFESFGERDTFIVNTVNRDREENCYTAHGMTIIHRTQSLPAVDYDFHKVQNYYLEGESVDYVITPRITTIDEGLRSLKPKKYKSSLLNCMIFINLCSTFRRGCLFSDEKYLRFYQKYSLNECLEECQSNLSLKLCNCVKIGFVSE